jgi:zinc protease
VNFGSAPERAEELTRATLEEMERVKASGPSAEDLAKVKETMLRDRETNLERNAWWLAQLATYLQRGDDPRAILANARFIGALTTAQVQDAARRWLDTTRYVKARLMPESGR